jgi:hypothetical protein
MAMPRIKFTTTGANSLIGGFTQGDMLTCGDALAQHLVESAHCAEYLQQPVSQAASVPAADATTNSKPRKRTARNKEPQP